MSTKKQATSSATEQERRRELVRDALAQVRLEGLEPDPAFFDYAERYARGEMTIDEAIADFVAASNSKKTIDVQ